MAADRRAEHIHYQSRDAIVDVYGERTPYYGEGHWPQRQDEQVSEIPDEWIPSACIMCSIGCGLDIGVKGRGQDRRMVGVRGRPNDRVNRGRLGPKGMNCHGNVNHHPDRLIHPLVRKNGELVQVSWDEAMDVVVRQSKVTLEALSNHGLGFYTSGQLFAEEYYTLAVMTKAGLGSLHCDGNTRLCTATAAAAMRESFGSDGQPSSYTDIDTASAIFLSGHNPAATGTVLWTRILDRLAGSRPPKVVVMDSRVSATAEKATVHLRPKIGTNLCVLNGIIRLLIENAYIDKSYIDRSTIGFEEVRKTCEKYTPEYVEKISNVPAATLINAAEVIGRADRLLCTALQGVYQSNQATPSAVAINNIALLRGMIGKPGGGVLQMNGQPTAQNNRECGANGEYPGFRNYHNKRHMQDLADIWKVDYDKVPHWNLPTPIMTMMSYLENGSINFFWVSGTNPAVSLVDLERFRKTITQREVFLVVQDIFLTETAQLADVVLPAAMWGEKTGIFTNVDRTVHLSQKAVDPPGECRSDLDIFIDYARRMDFKDKHGDPLVHWSDAEGAFEAWKKSTINRPCDYSYMTYDRLRAGPIQWPCNEQAPNGTERLYIDGVFPTDLEHAESWGHDLQTGAPLSKADYELLAPKGRALLKACDYVAGPESADEQYPLQLSTGRSVYHFHTRSKTGRSRRLEAAYAEAYVYVNGEDALKLHLEDDEMVVVESKRGAIEVPVKVAEIEPGCCFVPFHFGTFDNKDQRPRAANELTISAVDPISKQPCFKGGAVRIRKAEGVAIHQRHEQAVEAAQSRSDAQRDRAFERRRAHLGDFLVLVETAMSRLDRLYDEMREQHASDTGLHGGFEIMKKLLHSASSRLEPFLERHGHDDADTKRARQEHAVNDVDRFKDALFVENRPESQVDAFTTLMDIQSCRTLLGAIQAMLVSLAPTSLALRDKEGFDKAVDHATNECRRQAGWLESQLSVRAPQTLIVPTKQTKVET